MIRNVQRKYFEVWGTEEAQNTFLKTCLLALSILLVIQTITLCVLSLRKPDLFAVGDKETKMFTVIPPSEELLTKELDRVVRKYVETHYNWDNSTVENAHKEAAKYVAAEFVKAFTAANAEQIKITKEKRISQKIYVASASINPKLLNARVSMDRILTIEGLRTTSPLTLDITFEYGQRTISNSEGIYITGEKVVTQSGG